MALFVTTNVSSINAHNKLIKATNLLNTTYQRLASGLRINSAKDDAAGLQISNRMTAQINGLTQGNRNANDGIALAQTAEGAMDEMTTMLQKVRTLSLQAANGTNTKEDRAAIQKDVAALDAEVTRISEKTTFNGQTLLSGKDGNNTLLVNGKVNFQVGSNANDILDVDLSNGFSITSIVKECFNNNNVSTKVTLTSVHNDETSIAGKYIKLDTGEIVDITKGSDFWSTAVYQSIDDPTKLYVNNTGANKFFEDQNVAGNINGKKLNVATVNNSITTTIDANVMYSLIRGTNVGSGGKATQESSSYDLVNQISSNVFGISISQIADVDTINATDYRPNKTEYNGTISLNTSTYLSSQSLLELSDSLIAYIDGYRADLGSIQNRMESTIRNQANIMENTTDARSRIRDTDFALETANLTQQSIIQQAASSMLMQANQRSQIALSLLG